MDGIVATYDIDGEVQGFGYERDPTVPEWAKQPEKPLYSYEELTDKPSVNGVGLIQDKSIEDLGVKTMTNQEILDIFNRVIRRS